MSVENEIIILVPKFCFASNAHLRWDCISISLRTCFSTRPPVSSDLNITFIATIKWVFFSLARYTRPNLPLPKDAPSSKSSLLHSYLQIVVFELSICQLQNCPNFSFTHPLPYASCCIALFVFSSTADMSIISDWIKWFSMILLRSDKRS